jgi:hypothetical protein
MFATVAKNKH